MSSTQISDQVHEVEILTDIDRQTAEALYLDLRRLAKQRGLEIRNFRVKTMRDASVDTVGANSGETNDRGAIGTVCKASPQFP